MKQNSGSYSLWNLPTQNVLQSCLWDLRWLFSGHLCHYSSSTSVVSHWGKFTCPVSLWFADRCWCAAGIEQVSIPTSCCRKAKVQDIHFVLHTQRFITCFKSQTTYGVKSQISCEANTFKHPNVGLTSLPLGVSVYWFTSQSLREERKCVHWICLASLWKMSIVYNFNLEPKINQEKGVKSSLRFCRCTITWINQTDWPNLSC